MTVYKLYSAATATGDGAAQLDIVAPGTIVGTKWIIRAGTTGAKKDGRWELSFSSSSAFATNDTRSGIDQCAYAVLDASAGGTANSGIINIFTPMPDVPVAMGERLYIHNLATAAPTTMETTCFIFVDDKQGSAGRRVRL